MIEAYGWEFACAVVSAFALASAVVWLINAKKALHEAEEALDAAEKKMERAWWYMDDGRN